MNQLTIAYCRDDMSSPSIDEVSGYLDKIEKHLLAHTPWAAFTYKPTVQFAIAHANNYILLKYYVNEKYIRAVNTIPNSPVYEDSCVEFFVSFDRKNYYNFEFNCIGTALVAYGEGRAGREFLSPEIIRQIKFQASSRKNPTDNSVDWDLTVLIPFSVFVHDQLSPLHGKICRANFQKCGDLLPEPHFVTWSLIQSANPDFHLPEFFGQVIFE